MGAGMLITCSGVVGGGKSRTAKQVVRLLAAGGVEARRLRFRSLCRLTEETPWAPSDPDRPSDAQKRWTGFRRRPLSAIVALGYAVRILAFRLSGLGSGAGICQVCDRYFYDNLAHYELRSRRERLYVAALKRLIPTPDLALLVVASVPTLEQRRPNYAREYLVEAAKGYRVIASLFPNLVVISTDPGQPTHHLLSAVVRAARGE
jgi:thymidylate kinase